MPTRPAHEIEDLARFFQEELEADAKDLVPRFIAETLPDMKEMGRPKFLAWVRDNWMADVAFPAQLLERLAPPGPKGLRPLSGLKGFTQVVKDAFTAQQQGPDTEDWGPTRPLPLEAVQQVMLQEQAPTELPAALGGTVAGVGQGGPYDV